MFITGTDTCMNTLMFGILQCFKSYVDITLNGSRQCTDNRPGNGFRYLYHTIKITWTRNGESCLDHVHAHLFQSLCHLNFLNGIQLTSRNLFTIT